MRVFIATGLPSQVQDRVGEVVARIRKDSGTFGAGPRTRHLSAPRWVAPEAMHLTLQFLGNVSPSVVADIDPALRVIDLPAFRISVRGIGFFPRETAPRVFWAGVSSEDFSRLAREIHRQTSALGFEAPAHPLKPHLTLARAKGDRRLDKAFVDVALGFRNHDFGSGVVDRFAVVESHLSSTGPKYSTIAEYLLSERDQTNEDRQ